MNLRPYAARSLQNIDDSHCPSSCSLFIFLLILILAAAVCRQAAAEDRPAADFIVGVSLALTGPFAEYGIAVKRGIDLAQAEKPELFSHLKFIFEDDAYDPKRTVSALSKFAEVDNADAVFIWGNEPALGAAPVAERRKIPALVVSQHPKSGAGYHYVIRFINPAEDFSRMLLNHLRSTGAGPRSFTVVQSEISFFNILLDEFQKNLAAEEKFSIVDRFTPVETDFKPVLLRLKALQPDYLGVYLVPPQIGPFFRQARELNFHPRIFGSTSFESSVVIESALGEMEGAVYSHLAPLPGFIDRFKAKYGDDIQAAYAAQSYDFAVLAANLFGQPSPKLPSDEVIRRLRSVPERSGSLGKYRIHLDSPSGTYFEFPVAVKQIKDGKIIVLSQGGKAASTAE